MTFNTESYDNEALSCEAFENRVHQILDDRLTLTGAACLMKHAAQCVECENKLLDYDCFADSINFLKQSTAEVTCIAEGDSRGNLLRQLDVGLVFLAAMLLICLNIFGGLSLNRSDNLSQRSMIEEAATVQRSPAIGSLAMAKPSPGLKSVAPVKRIPPTLHLLAPTSEWLTTFRSYPPLQIGKWFPSDYKHSDQF